MSIETLAPPASGCPFAGSLAGNSSAFDRHPVTRIVVGDRIKSQMLDERVISVAQAHAMLDRGAGDAPLTLHLGQGVDYDTARRLYGAAEAPRAAGEVQLTPNRLPRKASHALTHKHREANVAISEPQAVGDGTYEAQLLIDDRCADMSDHLTGEHVPGMVIAEAARQMMIAVTEKFYLLGPQRASSRFVTHQMEVDYIDFLLPLPVRLRYVPVTLRRAGARNLKASCEVHFLQGGQLAASAGFSYSVIEGSYLEARERAALDRVVGALDGAGYAAGERA